jgi:hypothetical protein
VRRGLRLTPARFQSTEDAQPPRRPRIDESLPIVAEGRLSAERQRDIKRAADLETVEAERRNADDLDRFGTECDRLAND